MNHDHYEDPVARAVIVDPNSVLVLTVPERHRLFVLNQLLPELTRLLGPDRYLVIVGDDINMTVQPGRPTNPETSTDQLDRT